MRTFFLFVLFLLPLGLLAQGQENAAIPENRFYTGIGLTNISYHIYYKQPKASGHIHTGYFAPIFFNVGYRLNDKVRLQLGLAYGGSKSRHDMLTWTTDTVEYDYYSRTRVVAVSATLQHVLFRAFKRFPVYATASVLPAYGVSRSKTTETRVSGITTHSVTDSGLNIFTTAGFGFNYRISNSFQGYVELLPFKHNMTGENSFDRDWGQYNSRTRQLFQSVGIGVNYKL